MTEKPNPSTDPRWNPDKGGLPECAREVLGWASRTAGTTTGDGPHVTPSTIDSPKPLPGTLGAHIAASPEERRHQELMSAIGKLAEGIAALIELERRRAA